jgi:ATP-dependent RNA helicase DDX54/DBP10
MEEEDEENKSIIDYDNELNKEQSQFNNSKNNINEEDNEEENENQNGQQNKKAKKAKGFKVFHLTDEIYQGIKNIGYKNPTPIQKKIIPEIMSGFNIIAHSRTGSGKTAAFLLPMLAKLKKHSQIVGTRCLILSPVRDLAYQTGMFCRKLGKFTDLRFALIAGGKGFDDQFERLAQNPDIIIATPGRVLHHIEEGSLQLKKIEMIIIDEADKMMELSMGDQIRKIIQNCPPQKQMILLSATIQEQLATFLKSGIIKEYKILSINEENKIPEKLKIHLIYTRRQDKLYTLISLLKTPSIIDIEKQLTIVFVMTKYHCDYLQEILKYWEISSLVIYGSMEQDLRNTTLEDFKKGRKKILIVTDVAARGIDIPLLDNVINFDFPDNHKLFIHRVGRTARAGKSGRVFNLINSEELPYFFDIKYYLGKKFVLSSDDEEAKKEDTIDNYNTISFGSIPEQVILNMKNDKRDYLFNTGLDIEELYKSMQRAEKKGLTFKQKPSRFGIAEAKKLINEFNIKIHPFYAKKYGDEEKQQFLNDLKNYKPKELYFEKVNESTVDEKVLKEFKSKVDTFHKKKEYEKELEKKKEEQEEQKHIEDDKIYEEEQKEIEENNKKIEELKLLGKKVKRSKIRNFKNLSQYISNQKEENNEISKNLWGGEKPIELEELTMNINTDDTYERVKKTVWNSKKKTFQTQMVDGFGNKIKNESGQMIKKSDKYHPYKEWKKKSKLSIQSVGEIENQTHIRNVKERIMERKENKKSKSTLKSFEEILKGKKKQFKENQKKNKQFSKKKYKENMIKQKVHLNSKTQTFIKTRRMGKGSKSKGTLNA